MSATGQAVTYLFSDIEGSTRLWENEPERMRPAVAHHFAILDAAIARHHGALVKKTGDGVHAAFDRPADAVAAVVDMQLGLREPHAPGGIGLKVRCGLHWGLDERRDGDFYGPAVNRAARIMSIAHGGQILISHAVAERARDALPDGVALRDLGTVRLRDLSTPERVYQVVHTALRAEFPALRSLEATPNNLAQQLNSFVGRERELQEVRELLARNRLVTLLGMGGLGKSRLSVQLAAEVLDDYPDGVWMVELAALSDPTLVAQATASVLGVKEDGGSPVLDALVRFVRDRKLLLVLDNCEHVVQACAELAQRLLQSGAGVRILATSRDSLQTAGEAIFHVAPLAASAGDADITADSAMRIDAVRLFVDRSVAAQPSFRLTNDNVAMVLDVCRHLDGIPLAIELAAARMRALSLAAIVSRLSDRFKLLVAGDRTVLPRQRTLRALIDWSYDLLPDFERRVFQRLAVFAGGCTLEAAEAVCAGDDLASADVLDYLVKLVEKSLVLVDLSGDRYRMLETVRQYAMEKLGGAGDEVATRNRHLGYLVSFVEFAQSELVGPDQGKWLARLDADRENLLAAHTWVGDPASRTAAETGLRLVSELRPYWVSRGLLMLGYRMTTEALARGNTSDRSLLRCRGLLDAGTLCYFMGRYKEAQRHFDESLSISRQLGDRQLMTRILQSLGIAHWGLGDTRTAQDRLQEALELARALGAKRDLAGASNALAQIYRAENRLDEAEPLYRDVVRLARELGHREGITIGLLNLSMVSVGRGALNAARASLLEVLDIAQALGSKSAALSAVEVTAGLAVAAADWPSAARLFGAAESHAEKIGLRRDPADQAFVSPLIDQARQALGSEPYNQAMNRGRALSLEHALDQARAWLANVDLTDLLGAPAPRSGPA